VGDPKAGIVLFGPGLQFLKKTRRMKFGRALIALVDRQQLAGKDGGGSGEREGRVVLGYRRGHFWTTWATQGNFESGLKKGLALRLEFRFFFGIERSRRGL